MKNMPVSFEAAHLSHLEDSLLQSLAGRDGVGFIQGAIKYRRTEGCHGIPMVDLKMLIDDTAPDTTDPRLSTLWTGYQALMKMPVYATQPAPLRYDTMSQTPHWLKNRVFAFTTPV
jgi:hypothetical protein